MKFKILEENFTVCKINNISEINFNNNFIFVGKTDDEISLVCDKNSVPKNCVEKEENWKVLKICGKLDFSLIGILSKITTILAENKIGVFVISTYNTDYILINQEKIMEAVNILSEKGYDFCE